VVFLDSLAAAVLTALSAAMVAWLVRRQGRRTALFLGIAAGLATASWSIASRCLWQHTGAQFSLLLALCVLDGEGRRLLRLAAAAALLALTFWCRPALAPACVLVLVFQFLRNPRLAIAAAVTGIVFAGGWIMFNLATTGRPLGTYISLSALGPDPIRNYPVNLLGTILSPNRGMLVFSPLLLLAVPAVPWYIRRVRTQPRQAMLAGIVLAGVLVRGFFHGWFGGHCYGSRFMLDVSGPALVLVAPMVAWLLARWWAALLPLALFALSAGIQFLGVVRDFESWNIMMEMHKPDNAWNWRKPQILHCLTYGASSRDPLASPTEVDLPRSGIIELRRDPASPFIRYGFKNEEPWGNWIMPPRAGIAVNLPVRSALRFRLGITTEVFPYDPTTVGLFINGKKFGELVILVKDWDFASIPWFDIPVEMVKEGLNEFEFRVNRAYYPNAAPTGLGAAINKVIIIAEPGGGAR
jgi:hypothetical protein